MEGKIFIAELRGCDSSQINSERVIRDALVHIARACQVEVIRLISHKFMPQGITAVAIIGESHIAIHTWPETGYMSVLVYSCGRVDPKAALPVVKGLFRHSQISFRGVNIGLE